METQAFFRSPRSISSSQLVSCAFTHLFFLENELTPVTSQSSINLPPERFKWQAGYSLNKTTTGSAQGQKVGMRWTHDDNPATQHNKGKPGANSAPDCPRCTPPQNIIDTTCSASPNSLLRQCSKKKASSLSKSRLWRSTAGILWKVTAPSRYTLSNFNACPGRLNNHHMQLGEGMSTVCSLCYELRDFHNSTTCARIRGAGITTICSPMRSETPSCCMSLVWETSM